jgi:hypothetical protein
LVVTTHNQRVADTLGGRQLHLVEGRIVEQHEPLPSLGVSAPQPADAAPPAAGA